MARSQAYLKTASLILIGAIFASSLSSAVVTDGAVKDITRVGLADVLLQKLAR